MIFEIFWKLTLGTLSGEFRKYYKFDTYQEFMGTFGNLVKFGEMYKTVSNTNINISILFDHWLTCMQTNSNL